MTAVVTNALHDAAADPSVWTDHPEAEALVADLVARATNSSAPVATLADRVASQTATSLTDWLDHVVAPVDEQTLTELDWRSDGTTGLWRHPTAELPAMAPGPRLTIGVRVDDVDDAAAIWRSTAPVVGTPGSPLRTVLLSDDGTVTVRAVERRSFATGTEPGGAPDDRAGWQQALHLWRTRPLGTESASRDDLDAALASALDRARAAVGLVGGDIAAAAFLQVERERWTDRNTAARLTLAAQRALGLGWANRDHHTFRSSRVSFATLLALLDLLGFERREQFHAGADAGWGAQVLEHPGTGEVVFADVDLSADEVGTDLTRPLAPAPLGPVGTWCAVHGDSVLAAGMHHLAVRCRFDDWPAVHPEVDHQPPFSDLEDLRQRFTAAEPWPVDRSRVRTLVDTGEVAELGDLRTARTMPGSHLELIERRWGFKGFNQTSVSTTISENDLRHGRERATTDDTRDVERT